MNLADPELDIQWPIPLEESERSEADLHHPMLRDARPMAPRRTMVTGCNGQLGHAIRDYVEEHGLEGFEFNDIDTFDFSDPAQYDRFDWSLYGTIINAGAYTAVDRAGDPGGRPVAWKANAQGPALLARVAHEHNITLVHVSSDYVFDGTAEEHDEEEAFAPLGVYGQTKAAGDIAVANAPRHYILRSSWVIGEGRNFVKTMMALSDRVAGRPGRGHRGGRPVRPPDLHPRHGRGDLPPARLRGAVRHVRPDRFGRGGSWADIARKVFDQANGNGDRVRPISTAETSRTRRPRSARVRRIPPCPSPRSRTPGTTRRIGRKPSRHTSPRNLASKGMKSRRPRFLDESMNNGCSGIHPGASRLYGLCGYPLWRCANIHMQALGVCLR